MKKIKESLNNMFPKGLPFCKKVKEGFSKNKLLSYGVLVVALAFVIGYFFKGTFVAATINGRPVTRLRVIRELEKSQGLAVLDNLITEEIIRQGAKKANIQVTPADIATKISEIEISLTEQGQSLDQILTLQNMTRKELEKNIELQTLLEKILSSKINITDEEIAAFIETNKASFPETMDDAQKKETARQQLYQQKLGTEYQTWIDNERGLAKINYFVEY